LRECKLLNGETPVRARQCRDEWKNKTYFSGTSEREVVSEKLLGRRPRTGFQLWKVLLGGVSFA
jgi:hypothetical protein